MVESSTARSGTRWNRHSLEVDEVAGQDRHVLRAGDGSDPQIHRADPNALASEDIEHLGRLIIEGQDLGARKIGENRFQPTATANDSPLVLGSCDVGVPTQDLLVEGNDRDIEIGLRML